MYEASNSCILWSILFLPKWNNPKNLHVRYSSTHNNYFYIILASCSKSNSSLFLKSQYINILIFPSKTKRKKRGKNEKGKANWIYVTTKFMFMYWFMVLTYKNIIYIATSQQLFDWICTWNTRGYFVVENVWYNWLLEKFLMQKLK